jgi:cytochrome c oxidase subunit III
VKRRVIDVSELPTYAFGARDPLWWGVGLLIAIEGTMLVLLAVSYFYVRARTTPFPPVGVPRGIAVIALVEVALWLVSIVPTWREGRAAIAKDLGRTRRQLIIATVLGIVAVVLRWYEVHLLPFRWDSHAYGSVVWAILALHLSYLILATAEVGIVVLWLVLYGFDQTNAVDVTLTAAYWYWVVGTWVVLYGLVYWLPRVA